jgi:pimeloyl-ACP methyl ester carboxylesterase
MRDPEFERNFRLAVDIAVHITDWKDASFTWEKCFVASIMSEAAYHELPGFELRDRTRAKLIPCDVYQRLYARGVPVSVREALLSMDNAQIRVIVRREMVVVVIRLNNVVFVAFRGTTASTDDLITDFKVFKIRAAMGSGAEPLAFHRGFYNAVAQGFMEVCDAVAALDPAGDLPQYVVGHSLGGAMSSIFSARARQSYRFRPTPNITGAYVFGMPRYCDSTALFYIRQPHQICNEFDAVPSMPPRRMGYADPPGAIFLSASGGVLDEVNRGDMLRAWRDGVEVSLSFADHRLDRYVERCEVNAKRVAPALFAP